MTPHEARALLAALPPARERWLAQAVACVDARSVWLAGSLGRGQGDEWSDVDLIVVDGAPILEGALVTVRNPGNGPVGGGYVGALYDLGPLPLWVDWYTWPASRPVPSDARALRGTGAQGTLDLRQSLDQIGRGRPDPHPDPVPDPEEFVLAMLPLAAKFVARGMLEHAAGMAAMLGAPPDPAPLERLRSLLSSVLGHAETRRLVHRYLEVVAAITRD
ncbi:hypothetical protein KDL01_15690 [Actinospica durhamensis]|uniref:Nucleotidyltransferase domain-containing protein n=1 Tax=Actinospica durhamensis TaxID=1508375 RepID=A0A941IQY6_9ACTN|nr:hypothetical protein [Actinospica durhamensis]MBR7834717.1 hypothetical protein [Actinospica durhamensis]